MKSDPPHAQHASETVFPLYVATPMIEQILDAPFSFISRTSAQLIKVPSPFSKTHSGSSSMHSLGTDEGSELGSSDEVGSELGATDGLHDGIPLGADDGSDVGSFVGTYDGSFDG